MLWSKTNYVRKRAVWIHKIHKLCIRHVFDLFYSRLNLGTNTWIWKKRHVSHAYSALSHSDNDVEIYKDWGNDANVQSFVHWRQDICNVQRCWPASVHIEVTFVERKSDLGKTRVTWPSEYLNSIWQLDWPFKSLFMQKQRDIKPPHHWTFARETIGDRWILVTGASNTERVSNPWRHHVKSAPKPISCIIRHTFFS